MPMNHDETIERFSVTRDGIAGFLLGMGVGTLLGLFLYPPADPTAATEVDMRRGEKPASSGDPPPAKTVPAYNRGSGRDHGPVPIRR